MNKYMHLIISTVKKLNFIALAIYLFPFLSVTYYKIFHVGNRNFLEVDDPSISWTILIPIFILVLLQSYSTPIIMLHESSRGSIYKMVPGIRRVKLIFSGSYMLLIMIWSIYILGSNDLVDICAFVMFSLWFISLLTATLFGFKFMYRSRKYNLLKVLFYFLHSVIVGIYSMLEYQGINSSFLVLIFYLLFISIVAYQFINFYKNYSNYKEDYETNFRSGWKKILVNDFLYHLESSAMHKSVQKLISVYKKKSAELERIKLLEFSLFPYTSNRILIFGSLFFAWIIFALISILGIKYGLLAAAYLYNYSGFTYTGIFRNKELIEHLYITSGLVREKFEMTVLKSAFYHLIRSSASDLVILTIGFYIYSLYNETVSYLYVIIIFAISFIAISLTVYGCWKIYLNGKDYDVINKKRKFSI